MKRLLVLCALAVGASFAPVFGPASARAADLACPDKLQFATASAADVLTTQEAAAFLKIPATNLVEAAAAGLIPARNVLGEWRFLRPALVAWLSGIDAPQDCFSMPAPDLRDLEARAPTQVLPAPGVRPAPEVHPAPGVRPAPGVVPGPDLALRPEDLARIDGAGAPGDFAQAPGAPPAGQAPASNTARGEEGSFGEAPQFDTARDVALRDEGILQDSRDLTLELDIGYTRTDRLVGIPIAPGFGLATLAESKTEALVTGLTARYSLTDDLEVSATGQVENVRQELKFGTTSSSQHSSRFGDVALAARYQAVREGPNTPGVVVSADTRLPTDDDRAFALGGGVSLVKRSDPAVLFAAGSYLHTFSDETNDPLRLQPENSYALRAGLSLGLNEALSVNGSFEFDADEATSFDNGLTLPARETFGLRFGVTSLINRNLYLEPSVRLQVNDVANSVTFNLGIPYTFR